MGIFDPAIFDADVFDIMDADAPFTGQVCLYNRSTHSRATEVGKTSRAVIISQGRATVEPIR